MTGPFALITGMRSEAKVARRAAQGSPQVLMPVLVAGPGAPHAAEMVDRAKALGAQAIVSFGMCGGLKPGLSAGTVIIAQHIAEAGSELPVKADGALHARLQDLCSGAFEIHTGALVTTPEPVAERADKAALFASTGASAVDMESAVLAGYAGRAGLAFAALRVVLDDAGHSVPPAFAGVLKANGGISAARLLATLITRWPGFGPLRDLARAGNAATAVLSKAAQCLVHRDS